MRDNKGFSFIEAIVVIAIMAVLAVGVVVAIGSLAGWRVTDCASDVDAALKETKVNAMSKFSAYMEIRYDGASGDYFLQESGLDAEKIASGNITITYTTNKGDVIGVEDGVPLIISYDRSSGAFKPVISSVADDGTFSFLTDSDGDYVYCSQIVITNGSKTKTITLVKDTGKHSLE